MSRQIKASARTRIGHARSRVVLLAVGLAVAGCAKSAPVVELPDLVKDPRKLLTKDEQQRAISDIGQAKNTEMTAAEKKIQASH